MLRILASIYLKARHVVTAVALDIRFFPTFFADTMGKEFVGCLHRLLDATMRTVELLIDSCTLLVYQFKRRSGAFIEWM